MRDYPECFSTAGSLALLASHVCADAPGLITVLSSGPVGAGISSADVIAAMLDGGDDIRAFQRTPVAQFLNSPEFLAAVAKVFGVAVSDITDDVYEGPATEWLYEQAGSPCVEALIRFTEATVGEVYGIVAGAHPLSAFGVIEVPRIIASPHVTYIEGLPRAALAGMSDRLGQLAAFEMIVGRADERMERLRVPATHDALRDENNVLRLDSRDYFRGTTVIGHSSAVDHFTHPLSVWMAPPTEHAQAGRRRWDLWHGRVADYPQKGGGSSPRAWDVPVR
ncbi:hypothetical protein [Stenotrophomonas sp. C3(2023)]|uniref:hypothetical protein n=1 Tax=Stenotrophomonas sp. C3(2023) TaxID=3080277 RepID=UPI00293EAE8F|nr:hypothetical protein [Stenotrophomonas sp. C3(2023)]